MSFEVLENVNDYNLGEISGKVSLDFSLGDQMECRSLRLIFYKNTDGIEPKVLGEKILDSMVNFERKYPRKNNGDTFKKKQFYKIKGAEVLEKEDMAVVLLKNKPDVLDIDNSQHRFVVVYQMKDKKELKDFIE